MAVVLSTTTYSSTSPLCIPSEYTYVLSNSVYTTNTYRYNTIRIYYRGLSSISCSPDCLISKCRLLVYVLEYHLRTSLGLVSKDDLYVLPLLSHCLLPSVQPNRLLQ